MASRGFWRELKRRHVYRVAAAYAIVGWLLIQVVTQVFPIFHLPDWIDQAIVLLILIGFPIALVLAWAFDATPQGIVLTDVQDSADVQPSSRSHRAVLVVGLIGALIALLAGAGWWHAERGRLIAPAAHDKASTVSVATPSAASTAAGVSAAKPRVIPASSIAAQPIPAKSIAVLPFENLSEDKGNAYFADGMQDMILTKLADIGDLKVISRTSTEKYASHPDNLKLIAQQLGVASILEGSVQKVGNQVLINVQLIDARSDNHLWANAYPRTLDNVFGVEGEVAQKVADALQAKLSPAEVASVAKVPTRNAAAYDSFLKAEYQFNRARESWLQADFLSAEAHYRRASALDPGFALAYARLAYCQLSRHWFTKPLTEAEMADVKTSIDHALALAPDLADAHLALAYYDYWGFNRYDAAIAEFQRALQLQPGNAQAIAGLGFVSRRNGHWPQGLIYLQKAVLISPRDGMLRGEYGSTFTNLRRYAEADQQLRLALDLDPTNANTRDQLLLLRLFGFGDVAGARQAYTPPPAWRLSRVRITAGEILNVINPRVYPDMFERHFDAALREWDTAPTDTPEDRLTGQVARVTIEIVAGQRAQAEPECEKLAPQLQAALKQQPGSLKLLQQSSWMNVCLGRNAEAVANARRAVALLPITKDSYSGADQLAGLAQIDAQTGAPDEALQLIRQLLAMPAGAVMSVERLKLDPVWDPIRKDPRFQALLKGENAAPAGTRIGAQQ